MPKEEKGNDLRSLGNPELYKRLQDSHEELFKLRFQKASKQLTNTNRIREVRHTVARLKTILYEREAAGQR